MNQLFWMRLFYDTAIVLYAVSLTFMFSDVIEPRRTVNRSALLLLFFAFLCVTGLLFDRFQQMHVFPAYTRSDLMFLICWIMLVTTLVLNTFLKIGLVLFFTNVVGFAMILLAGYHQSPSVSQLFPNQDLLLLHILLAMLSETAFAFGFVFAVMYLLQHSNLRQKRWNRWFLMLPSLARLDIWCLITSAIGFFLLMVAMAIGDVWGKLVLHHWIVWAPKPIATIVTWVLYGVYLWVRNRTGYGSKALMNYQVICFLATIVNLLAVGNLSPFHHSA